MWFVSPILKRVVYPTLHHAGVLNRITPPATCTVVNYHGVLPAGYSGGEAFLDGNLAQPEVFRRQLQFLKTNYQVIHTEDFRSWIEQGKPLPSRAILLTCDDGLANTLTDMLPILQSERVSCLFFVTAASCGDKPGMLWYEELYLLMRSKSLTGRALQLLHEPEAEATTKNFHTEWWTLVGRASRLDAQSRAEWVSHVRRHCGSAPLNGSERRWRLLTVGELKKLADAGMSIGAHTLSHPILSLCSDNEARREIQQSKLDLERALGRPIWAFAYPFGNPAAMGKRELRLAQEAGFSCAFLNVENWSRPANVFALPRIHVTSDMMMPEFAAHVSGLHARLQRAAGGPMQ